MSARNKDFFLEFRLNEVKKKEKLKEQKENMKRNLLFRHSSRSQAERKEHSGLNFDFRGPKIILYRVFFMLILKFLKVKLD